MATCWGQIWGHRSTANCQVVETLGAFAVGAPVVGSGARSNWAPNDVLLGSDRSVMLHHARPSRLHFDPPSPHHRWSADVLARLRVGPKRPGWGAGTPGFPRAHINFPIRSHTSLTRNLP